MAVAPRPPRIPDAEIAGQIPGVATATSVLGGNNADFYRLEHTDGRRSALKVIRPDVPLERTDRELVAIQRVNHPFVVPYRGSGTLHYNGASYPYLLMDWVDGQRLTDGLPTINALPLDQRVELIVRLLEGVDALDAQRVVHRDLKPDNVMLTGANTPVIVDLGWARLTDATPITTLGANTGTRVYNSPEQLRGERVDGRSDLFAVGIIAYKILIGRHPFWSEVPGEPPDWSAHENGRPVVGLLADPAVTDELADSVDALLEADPVARPASGQIAAENIRAAMRGGRPTLDVFPRAVFLAAVGNHKAHLATDFFPAGQADGLVLETRVNYPGPSAQHLQLGNTKHRLVDPSSIHATWTQAQLPAGYAAFGLPHSVDPAVLDDPAQLATFVQTFITHERDLGANVLLAPYVFAGVGEEVQLERSLAAAEYATTIAGGLPVLAVVALDAVYLVDSGLRSRVLRMLTGTRVPGFYVLVSDGHADFAQLDRLDLLQGMRQLTAALVRNRKAVVFGKTGSVGLALLTAGAAGFATGAEAKSMHFVLEDPTPAGGGPSTIERYYVRSLFGFLRANELRPAQTVVDLQTAQPPLGKCTCPFCSARPGMFNGSAAWDSDVALRHFLWSLAQDAAELRTLRLQARRAWLANRLDTATSERAAIGRIGIALSAESRTPNPDSWRRAFCR